MHHLVGSILSVMQQQKPISYESHSQMKESGRITHDYIRCASQPDSKKVVMVVPGANSDIEMNHVRAIVRKAVKLGYHAIVVNPVVPPQVELQDLEVIDYRESTALE